MPTYRFRCDHCGGATEQWLSIHHDASERPEIHADCGGNLALSIEQVVTYAIGSRGSHTRVSDATDREWHRDMDAYERFAVKGVQPQRITGCDRLEATAISVSEVESGGFLRYSDEQVSAGKEEARQIIRDAAQPA